MRNVFYLSITLIVTMLLSCSETTKKSAPNKESSSMEEGVLMGFLGDRSQQQQELETKFDELLSAEEMGEWMKRLAARPHHLGSAYDKENAYYIDSLFKSWGFETKIETYHVLFPTPKERKLELIAPHSFKAKLKEEVIPGDPYTEQTDEQLPPYHVFSADGDVTAGLVFVNYGLPEDYKRLEKMGVSVKGKIAIAKYGRSWRGIKPRLAYEHGAVGALVYSDPQDDGYGQGDVYPDGPYRNSSSVQRGSVTNLTVYPGDPLTPGIAATKDAKRLKIEDAEVIKKIPTLPISYEDAQPLLEAMGGPTAPADWVGGLPITYHLGGDDTAKVHFKLAFNWDLHPTYNVVATMKGTDYPDQWVIRGNHHDGWVNGAADPLAGMVAELGEAKAIGALAKQGLKPKRTLIYIAWDAEEPAMLGSTEWVEDYADELKEKAVAYINTDGNARGFLNAGGSHSLEKFFTQIAFDVEDPQTGISVGQRSLNRQTVNRGKKVDTFRIGALGSGSDYSAFIDHLGIASMNLGFGGEGVNAQYHSIYDNYTYFSKFLDPGFHYEEALAKVAGRTALRLANADILPFDFVHFHQTVERYANEVKDLADDMREKTDFENQLVRDDVYKTVQDPLKKMKTPEEKEAIPVYNFDPLDKALGKVKQSAQGYQKVFSALDGQEDQQKIEAINRMLYKSERYLTAAQGLPDRPWFKHMIYAPGFHTGYGVKTIPGVREAIEQRQFDRVKEQIELLSETLSKFSQYIDQVAQEGK